MAQPQFAPFPDAKIRQAVLPDDWHLYIESCVSLADSYLRLNDDHFLQAASETDDLTLFLSSLFYETALDDELLLGTGVLRKKSFFLLHRLSSMSIVHTSLTNWPILSAICHVYPKNPQIRGLLKALWSKLRDPIEKSLQTARISLIKNLDSKRPEEAESTLNRLAPLLKVSPEANLYMLTGTDLVDALYSAYLKVSPLMQRKLVTIAYLGLTVALDGPKPNYSLLSDHLYNLRITEEQQQKNEPGKKTLVADLVTNTPLLEKIKDKTAAPEAVRVQKIAASMSIFRQSSIVRLKRPIRRQTSKGKSKVNEEDFRHSAMSRELHIHRKAVITQIQELFPNLGAGFIVKLLDEYNESIEQVTAHLLEDSLPSYLADADRGEELLTAVTPRLNMPSMSSQAYERRNIFDDDEFDQLVLGPSRFHVGRRNPDLDADNLLSDRSKVPAKSSVLAALAAFDSDDDERDDTYDAEDVGASVDTAAIGPDEADDHVRDKNEEILFRAYVATPEIFDRDSANRRSKARTALKSETHMTDEAIEGWGILLGRDPKRFRRLEAKLSAFSGQQQELESTSWRNSPTASGDEGGRLVHTGRGRGGRGGRGDHGSGRGAGNVAGLANDKGAQMARDRKDVNKASRANHDRKAGRGRKLARAGFPA